MATKAQIQALITSDLASGQVGGILALKHRNVLKDSENSFLEAIYANSIPDTKILETVTTANANFSYNVNISKVGRKVTITGNFDCINTQSANSTIFSFSDTNLNGLNLVACYGFAMSDSGDVIRVYVLGNDFKSANTVFAFENYYFSITYILND